MITIHPHADWVIPSIQKQAQRKNLIAEQIKAAMKVVFTVFVLGMRHGG